VIAQLSPPDMKLPIQMALTWPARHTGVAKRLDWTNLKSLEFEPIDHARFPAVRLAHEVIRRGGSAGATLNAANEVAVQAFLDGHIAFGQISDLVEQAMRELPDRALRTLQDAQDADAAARAFIRHRTGAVTLGT